MKTPFKHRVQETLNPLPVFIFIIVLIFSLSSCGGNKNTDIQEGQETVKRPKPPTMIKGDTTWVSVDEMPVFPGGDAALLKYIAENTRYPETAKKEGTEGKVIIRFCVTSRGNVTSCEVLQKVSPEIDAEALRVVSTLPVFEPGKVDGKAVSVWYMVPITFALK
jgi:periplasmic protein TonB